MAMTLVETVQVGSGGAASIEFTNIPQTGKDLLVLLSARQTASSSTVLLRFNNDTGNNYTYRNIEGNGSGVANSTESSVSYVLFPGATRDTYTASTFGNGLAYISNYTSSAAKSISMDGVTENNATAAQQQLIAGSWTGTAAISSIQLVRSDIMQHSTVSLYIIS